MVTYYINKDRKNRKLKRDFFFSFSLFLFSFFFWWLTIQLNGIRKLPPEKFPPGKPHQWNLPLVNSQKIPTSNIPTHVFKYSHRGFLIFCFFIITTVIIILLKRLFYDSSKINLKTLKSELLRFIRENLACRPKWLQI